ncbi:hypothetical protein [Chryseobacterium herbae]|uniref:Uncharacterized protein n=1 Tax=Chryseobacterium herbae TaxID=2976476 RepID=A0ABT2IW15_9FLAO|nr:hypothetical protein [Chryseobacterium sp. pc1-10]MCT2563043.1 hypothetical protein [Chryseobacterium sp. pc1-10]
MDNNSSAKKESFDADHGFIFMQTWPSVLRWILVLPVALIIFLLTNGLSNWAMKISSADWFIYTVSFVFHTLASAVFVYYGAATAPGARKIVMAILSVILIAAAIVVFTIPQERYNTRDLSATLKIINVVSTILGIVLAYFWRKQKPNQQNLE